MVRAVGESGRNHIRYDSARLEPENCQQVDGWNAGNVTLTPCPAGIDTTSGVGYQIFYFG